MPDIALRLRNGFITVFESFCDLKTDETPVGKTCTAAPCVAESSVNTLVRRHPRNNRRTISRTSRSKGCGVFVCATRPNRYATTFAGKTVWATTRGDGNPSLTIRSFGEHSKAAASFPNVWLVNPAPLIIRYRVASPIPLRSATCRISSLR